MGLRSRITAAERRVPGGSAAGAVLPGGSAEELAVEVAAGRTQIEDVPAGDPRRVESLSIVAAHLQVLAAGPGHPGDPPPALSYPSVRAALLARESEETSP